MSKKGYDILSWIFLVVIVVLFALSIYLATSSVSSFAQNNFNAINSGNVSRDTFTNNFNDVKDNLITVNYLKIILYVLGGVYSIIIFILCFKLKTGTLVKLIVLIGGILTYGLLAILTYFFDVRKKFDSA